jgi:DNA invertase Pin-like site-specific DNA recombinase
MTPQTVLGYVRVSTEKQADSLEAQTARIRAMAVVRGVELADLIVDPAAFSASLNRPGVTRLLALVDAGQVATVIVAKLDRLTRSVGDLDALLKRFDRRNVALVSVAESLDTRTSAGRLVIYILGSVAQWEREAIGERTKDVLQHKKAKGERVGQLPLGFQLAADGVHLEPNPEEQNKLARLHALRATRRSYRSIADMLNADGITTRKGTAWRHQYVAHALRRTS